METLFQLLETVDPIWVYVALFAIAYIENLFPPSPSDIMIVFGGSLVGMGRIDLVTGLLVATLGSTSGFMTMYKIGDWFGDSILEKRRIGFLPLDNVHKVEAWFRRYGYWIIIANRFLSGTRAVVSFFAGMSELRFLWTIVLCFLSALAWNAILIYAGTVLGAHWQIIGVYLSTYSQFITSILVVGLLVWFGWWLFRRSRNP